MSDEEEDRKLTAESFEGIDLQVSNEPINYEFHMPTREEIEATVKADLDGEYVYEPILVSPAQFADKVFMETLRKSYPKGQLVWRPRRPK